MLFIIFLLLILLFEGLGIPYGRIVSFYLIILLPALLFLPDFKAKKEIFVPKILSLIFLLFLVFSAISTTLSVSKVDSLRYLSLYIASYLLFIYAFNRKEEILNKISSLFIFMGIIFSFYSVLLNLFGSTFTFLIPQSGFQLVFSSFGSHNHLGDFLIIPIAICLYQFLNHKNIKYLTALAFFLPFFLISYSRSAYLGLLVVIIILFSRSSLKLSKIKFKFALLSLLTLLTIFFLATVREAASFPVLSNLNQFLSINVQLKDKYFQAKRLIYFEQAFNSFSEKPYFGVGPGNFNSASLKYCQNPTLITASSHNIFTDILVEHGLFAATLFVLFIALILFRIFQNWDQFGLIFAGLLVNFQSDYAFKIFGIFAVFMILAGLTFEEKSTLKTKLPLILSLGLILLIPFLFFGF